MDLLGLLDVGVHGAARPAWLRPVPRCGTRAVVTVRPSTEALLEAVARHRDRGAFAQLFQQLAPQIKRYLLRAGVEEAQADDLVQDVLLTVWRRADTFDPRRASATTWVFTIARNRRIDGFRRDRRPELDPHDPALVGHPDTGADAAIDLARSAEALRGAIDALPPEQAHTLERAYFEDRTLHSIAVETAVPLGTVKSRVRLALQRLRAALAPEGVA
jgi:RNA polymerase sigma-70 factor (ECF subfamily)